MQRKVFLVLALLAVGSTIASAAGEAADVCEPFTGFDLLQPLNPGVEHVFVDPGDLVTLDTDVHYDLDAGGPMNLWAGGGPALIQPDRGTSPRGPVSPTSNPAT
jgi:hypothetical protein